MAHDAPAVPPCCAVLCGDVSCAVARDAMCRDVSCAVARDAMCCDVSCDATCGGGVRRASTRAPPHSASQHVVTLASRHRYKAAPARRASTCSPPHITSHHITSHFANRIASRDRYTMLAEPCVDVLTAVWNVAGVPPPTDEEVTRSERHRPSTFQHASIASPGAPPPDRRGRFSTRHRKPGSAPVGPSRPFQHASSQARERPAGRHGRRRDHTRDRKNGATKTRTVRDRRPRPCPRRAPRRLGRPLSCDHVRGAPRRPGRPRSRRARVMEDERNAILVMKGWPFFCRAGPCRHAHDMPCHTHPSWHVM